MRSPSAAPPPGRPAARAGLTRVALAVALALLGLAAGVVVPNVVQSQLEARDARRLRDAREIVGAIERFHRDHGRYPRPDSSEEHAGWDVSFDGSFLSELVEGRYLSERPRDPVDDETLHYRYYVYAKGAYGCASEGPFYVLGIRAFEATSGEVEQRGTFTCAARDWGTEFAYVVGGGVGLR